MKHVRAWAALVILACYVWSPTVAAQLWPTSYAKIARALESEEVDERRGAAKRLHLVPPSVGRALIVEAMDDPDVQVRGTVGQLALARRYAEVAERVNGWLSDAEPSIRQLGARLLGLADIGEAQVTLLARLLSDPVADVRRAAASVLGQAQTEAEAAATALLNHLTDNNDGVKLAVIEALGALASPAATLPLLTKLQEPNGAVRRAALEALGEIDEPLPANVLNLVVADVEPAVRYAAVQTLARKTNFDAIDVLHERLRDDRDVSVRVAAQDALATLGAHGDCPAELRTRIAATLVDALGHVKQELRDQALLNLRRFPNLARPELERCVSEFTAGAQVSSNRRFACALALAHSDAQQAASASRGAAQERQAFADGSQRDAYELVVDAWRGGRLNDSELLAVLSAGKYAAGLPTVLALLSHPSAQVRAQALTTAYDLLDPRDADGRAVEPLTSFVNANTSPDEVVSAIGLLGHTGSLRAVPHLLPFIEATAPLAFRVAGFQALAEIKGAPVPVALVRAALQSDSAPLRRAAAGAVREGEWPGLGAPLVQTLENATYDEVEAIATALWGLAPTINDPALVQALAAYVERASARHQDALLEAFARLPWSQTRSYWSRWVEGLPCQPLAKVAEVLGGHHEARPLLTQLLGARCEAVKLNALWSLRRFDLDLATFRRVAQLAREAGPRLAGNAVAALAYPRARDNAGGAHPVLKVLCEGLTGGRWGAVALANALTALRHFDQRCEPTGSVERELLRHEHPLVRKRAAALLAARLPEEGTSTAALADRRALRLCTRHDVEGDVAATCLSEAPVTAAPPEHWMTILVVPNVGESALETVPYALEHQDGWVRVGVTDRRGAVLSQVHDASDVSLLRL